MEQVIHYNHDFRKIYIDPRTRPNVPKGGTIMAIYWDNANTYDKETDWHSVLTRNKAPRVSMPRIFWLKSQYTALNQMVQKVEYFC